MKEMLVSLRASLQAGISHSMCQFCDDICNLGDRVDHVESNMDEFAMSFNALLDSKNDRGGG